MMGHERRDRARREAILDRVGAARQRNRGAGAENDAGQTGGHQKRQALGEYITGFEIRNHENVGPATTDPRSF